MSEHYYARQLREIIQAHAWFMTILKAARACDPPDWFVGAGVVHTVVWDHLHGYTTMTPLADVDVVFHDPADLRPERDQAVQRCLAMALPEVPWEATNQAAVHLWYEDLFGTAVEPLHSTAEAIATWPETATCVGVRLLPNDDLLVAAPLGLDDLFQLILRRNPRRVSVAEYRRRLEQKGIRQKWPQVHIIEE